MKIIVTLFFCFSLLAKAEKLDWTIMFYIAADEEKILEPMIRVVKAIERISLLKKLSNNVALIAQIDKPGEDENFRYRFNYIDKPSKEDIDSVPLDPGPDFIYGEKDSGNPLTLKNFLNWSVRTFPAKHYILVLMGHSWGQQGMMQDFYVDGVSLETSTMIKNYELRRVIEEVYRENNVRFDAFIIDACSSAQLDVLLEYYELFDYIGASAIETPYNGIPWEDVLRPFLKAINKGTYDLEKDFFFHLVNEYVKSHLPGRKLALIEELSDPTEFVVIRSCLLKKVAKELKNLILSFPSFYVENWKKGENGMLELLSDADLNVDLLMFSKVVQKELHSTKSQKFANNLINLLGYKGKDSTMIRTTVENEKAIGAWVTWSIDKYSKWDIAVCNIIKSFTDLNILDNPDIVANEEIRFSDCADLYESNGPEIEPPNGKSKEINSIFGKSLDWQTKPSYLTNKKNKFYLSIWIDLLKKKKRKVFLRLPHTLSYTLTYLNDLPETYILDPEYGKDHVITSVEHKYPLYIIKKDSDISPLYVVEAHSNGTKFKHGLGIFLGHSMPTDEPYYCGRIPIEYIEPYPFSWNMETYEEWYKKEKDTSKFIKCGLDFYRLHKFQKLTRWADFIEGTLLLQ